MSSVERLRLELVDALPRLHDPTLVPSTSLRQVVGASPELEKLTVQAGLLAWIERLQPNPAVPAESRTRRLYDILRNRYVLGLTQEDTAERMGIGVRTVQRLQGQAIYALATHIWQELRAHQGGHGESADKPKADEMEAGDWKTQTRQELAALSATDPHAVSEVEAVIDDVLHDELILAHVPCPKLEVGFVQAGLTSPIHPIALRQILFTALRYLGRCVTQHAITLYARSEEGKTRITFTGKIDHEPPPPVAELLHDIIAPQTVTYDLHRESDAVFLSVWLPSTDTVTVLVVDDNADMVQFYRRCAAGSPYQLLHVATARAMLEMIQQTRPDIIVLDVMLPDEDGWHVLMRLHENPETRPIPVVVISVVREQELALSLGAAAYLSKPVLPHQFIETLDALAY